MVRHLREAPGSEHPIPADLADPLAKALFAQVRQWPLADQQQVLAALRARLRPDEVDPRRVWALQAFDAFVADCPGVTLSQPAYTRWHSSQPPGRWPTVKQIRGAFRSWSQATDTFTATSSAPDPAAVRLSHRGVAVTRDEMLAAVRAWHVAEPDAEPLHRVYVAWIVSVRGTPAAPPVRLPRHYSVFKREFGSFAGCLVAAGVLEDLPRRFTDGDLIDALRRCHADLGDNIGSATYDRWQGSADPSLPTILHRFGGWPAALQAAGIICARQAQLISASRRSFSDTEMRAGAAAVFRLLKPLEVTVTYYEHGRHLIRQAWLHGDSDAPPPHVPSASLLKRVHGDWDAVRRWIGDGGTTS